jgi:large subunit ribosomal protein L23
MAKAKKTTESKTMEEVFKKELSSQFYDIIKKVIMSEKATRLSEFENKMTLEVERAATKPVIKLLIENEFGKKVKSVNTVNSINGKKHAFVTFKDEGVASDLSSELGLL